MSEIHGSKQEAEMQVLLNGRVRRSEGEWREIFSRYEQSDLSAREFCQNEQIRSSSFFRWRSKLAGTNSSPFIPVTTASPEASSRWTLLITLPDGCQLRFEG